MTRKRIPCTLSSRVIGPSSHSGSLGRVRTLGKIRPMAFFFVHGKCQHYYESGQSSRLRKNGVKTSFSSSATSFAGRLRQLAVLTSATWAQRGGARRASHGLLREIANADQIVDREAEDEHPAHASRAPVPSLSQQTDRFQPAKDLIDALAFLLAHQIAGMPRGARIDRARTVRGVLRHVRRHLQPAKVRDERSEERRVGKECTVLC